LGPLRVLPDEQRAPQKNAADPLHDDIGQTVTLAVGTKGASNEEGGSLSYPTEKKNGYQPK